MSDARRESFIANVEPCPTTGCWLWSKYLNEKGYGIARLNRKQQGAHRVAWQLCIGPIPDGMCVLHHCDVPCCVNPAHLFLGTMKDNTHDAIKKGRVPQLSQLSDRPGHCFHGHAFSATNTYLYRGQIRCRECRKLEQRARRLRRAHSSGQSTERGGGK